MSKKHYQFLLNTQKAQKAQKLIENIYCSKKDNYGLLYIKTTEKNRNNDKAIEN